MLALDSKLTICYCFPCFLLHQGYVGSPTPLATCNATTGLWNDAFTGSCVLGEVQALVLGFKPGWYHNGARPDTVWHNPSFGGLQMH